MSSKLPPADHYQRRDGLGFAVHQSEGTCFNPYHTAIMSKQLGLSPHTMHQYVKGLFPRYHVHSRMELVEAIHAGRLSE